jgi:hypothetical protein
MRLSSNSAEHKLTALRIVPFTFPSNNQNRGRKKNRKWFCTRYQRFEKHAVSIFRATSPYGVTTQKNNIVNLNIDRQAFSVLLSQNTKHYCQNKVLYRYKGFSLSDMSRLLLYSLLTLKPQVCWSSYTSNHGIAFTSRSVVNVFNIGASYRCFGLFPSRSMSRLNNNFSTRWQQLQSDELSLYKLTAAAFHHNLAFISDRK